ncbi:MAG: alpha/beta hydrolase [Candidatus Gorgyraea atricola]|nr:alpha/beta hydrolase [Candidatus Gorgyraea atricola]
MMKNIIYIIIAVVFIFGYIRYFEYKSLYFPMKEIEITPSAVGLSYEDVYFQAEDGVKINAWFIPAKDSRFTLLFSHGNGGNISHRVEKILFLNGLGLDVFIFDYRGYGKSSGRPSEKGFYKDMDAAYDCLVTKRKISPERIIPYGESLGGPVALELARKKEVRAVITESTFSSTMDMAKALYPIFPSFLMAERFDSLAKIKDVKVPKLIIHSKNDDIVPFSLSLKLFNSAPDPKTHLILIGSHNSAYVDSKDVYLSGISEFLRGL